MEARTVIEEKYAPATSTATSMLHGEMLHSSSIHSFWIVFTCEIRHNYFAEFQFWM